MSFTLVLNAGGQSRRMGQPKSLLPVPPQGKALLLHVFERLQPLAAHVVIVANDPTIPRQAGIPDHIPILADCYPDAGTLGGIATGLRQSRDWALVAACDMPFVNPALFAHFQQLAMQTDANGITCWDAIVPRLNGFPEPLHALYHCRCLPHIEQRLANGERRAISFHPDVRVRFVDEAEMQPIDPELRSFVNANTPEEWQRVLQLIEQSL